MVTKRNFIKVAIVLAVLGASMVISPKAFAGTCVDSDGGQNYLVKGYVNLSGYGWDYCSNATTLIEQDCGADANGATLNYGRSSSYVCPNGCSEGACLQDITPPSAPTNIKVTHQSSDASNVLKFDFTLPFDADFSYVKIYKSSVSGQLGSLAASTVSGYKPGAVTGYYPYTEANATGIMYYTFHSVDLNGNESINKDQYSYSWTASVCDTNNFAAKCNGATATVTPNYSPYLDQRDASRAIDGDISTSWMGTWDTSEATVFKVKIPNKVAVSTVKIYFDSSADLPYKPSDSTVSDDAIFLPKELQIEFYIDGVWKRMATDTSIKTKGWRTYSITGDTDEIKFIIPDTWAWNKYPIINEISVSGSRLTPSVSPTPIPTIKVVSPNGGEQWVKGGNYEIKWTATDMSIVNILLYKGNNCSLNNLTSKQVCGNPYELTSTSPTAIAVNVPNTGVYKWTVPATVSSGSDFRIAIQYPYNLSLIDQSDMPFSIVSETPPSYCYPDGTLIKLPGDPKIYIIIDCQKKWIQTIEEFQKNNYSWSDVKEGAAETVNSLPNYAGAVNNAAIAEGAIIQVNGDTDVYIVKYVGSKKFKRLILNPSVFRSYGHLKWGNIIKVDQSTLDSFITSNLVKSATSGKMYSLSPSGDTGVRRFIKDAVTLQRLGYASDSIYEINGTDENSYTQGQDLQ